MSMVLSWEDQRRLFGAIEGLIGLCGDDRFGSFKVYPSVGVVWPIGERARLRLAYPDSRLDWRLSHRISAALSLAPAGGQWRVYATDSEQASNFHWRAWETEAQLDWRLWKKARVTLAVGQRLQQQLRFRLQDNSPFKLEPGDALYWSLGLQWQLQ